MQHAMAITRSALRVYWMLVAILASVFALVPRGAFATLSEYNVIPEILREIVGDNQYIQKLNLLGDASNILFQPSHPDFLYPSYDYIIIGSGPAGSVLANRLSESLFTTVLLIESGQPETFVQRIPVATSLMVNTEYLRTYDMEQFPDSCLNMEDEACPYPVGNALGGSSVVNYLIYTRGNKDDFDRWESAANSSLWSYNSALKMYNKFENSPLAVEEAPHKTALYKTYLKAGSQLNKTYLPNYNAGNQMGIGPSWGTSKNGQRMSAAAAYIFHKFPLRPNWHIVTNAVATKIIMNKVTKTAEGVKFVVGKKEYTKTAKREVIVSAGPFRSAQLLMLSGIGPKNHLLDKGVDFIHDLPVGERTQDHMALVAPTFIVNTTEKTLNMKRLGVTDFAQYPFGLGQLTMFLGLEAIAFHKTTNSERPDTCPDLELLFMTGGVHSDFGLGFRKTLRLKQDVYDEYYKPLEDNSIDAWTSVICNIHPRAVGSIRLRNNDPTSDPVINYPFFEDSRDLEDMLEGIREVIKYAETPAMKEIGARLYGEKIPGCEEFDFDSDDYWRCYIRRMTFAIVHMVGANRMGDNPSNSVVDSQLRVHGIKKLRVADTSVIPNTVSGHPQAMSYLIGETLAALLKSR